MKDAGPIAKGLVTAPVAEQASVAAEKAADTGQTTLPVAGDPQHAPPTDNTSHQQQNGGMNGSDKSTLTSNGALHHQSDAKAPAQPAANGDTHSPGRAAAPIESPARNLSDVQEAKVPAVNTSPFAGITASGTVKTVSDTAATESAVETADQQLAAAGAGSPASGSKDSSQRSQQQRPSRLRIGNKRASGQGDRSLFSPVSKGASPPAGGFAGFSSKAAEAKQAAAAEDEAEDEASAAVQVASKRRRQGQIAAEDDHHHHHHQEQQQQQHAGMQQHHSMDHSHIRRHHAVDDEPEDEANGGQAATAAAPAAAGHNADQQQQQQQQRRREGGHVKRAIKKAKGLLSFNNDDDSASADGGGSSSDSEQQQYGSLSTATANRFKQEAKQAAAAAKFTFKPSGGAAAAAAAAGSAPAAAAVGGSMLVDDDGDLRSGAAAAAAAAGLSQIHFGFATARGHRPYMEDRHTIITALNPSSTAAAAALAADNAPAAAAVANSSNGPIGAAAAAGGVNDGVGRSYAAIFDGHNGAGAAETAARKLHLLLASHPALRIYQGDLGPPAVVKQEEQAVGSAIKAAFRQVDDLVLGIARRDGTRDGATALVVLRLGHALYAAHAGDSRAVLCRDAAAYRLTEDHKPQLPHEKRRIEEAGGRVDFQRCWRVVVEPRDGRPGSGLAVSRSLGDLDFKEPQRFVECEPDVTRLLLLPKRDTFVVLGSDGLWDVLSDTDAVITAATALKAFAAEHGSNNSNSGGNQAAATTGAVGLHTGSSSSSSPGGGGKGIRFRPSFNLGLAKAAGATAELPEEIVYSDAAATAAAEALLAESMRRGTMDNVTVIVMLLQWS